MSNKRNKKNKKKKPKGFAAKMAAEVGDSDESTGGPFELPDNTEVALFVAPGPKELVAIERICSQVGMGTCVILLNARLSLLDDNFGSAAATKLYRDDFESVFCLGAAPQQQAPSCLLYRAYPQQWVLARKPAVGQPKPILQSSERPSLQECADAYERLDVSDMEKGVENLLENVANFFR